MDGEAWYTNNAVLNSVEQPQAMRNRYQFPKLSQLPSDLLIQLYDRQYFVEVLAVGMRQYKLELGTNQYLKPKG